MHSNAIPILAAWQNFYVIIGSAAATLTGLMFVVVTLTSRAQTPRTNDMFAAFGTPNVAHFCATLLIAATLSAPWQVLWNVSLLLGLCSFGVVIYVVIVGRRLFRQTTYQPVLEDWLWHLTFPLISYTALLVAAIVLPGNPVPALFVIAAATLLFLFIGIHNAWDTVTYVAIERSQLENKRPEQ